MVQVQIPYNYAPRDYQLPLMKALDAGKRRLLCVWHRRAGKDLTVWNGFIKEAIKKKGIYYYFLPSYSQGRKIIWDGINKDGFAFMDYIPKELIVKKHSQDMKITLVNGSIIQIVGADNIDSIVGSNPLGVVFSEYSLMKVDVWNFIRPILAENGGFAIFVYTPRGKNHAWNLQKQLEKDDDAFVSVLTVKDTNAISKEAIEYEKTTMPQALFKQEYYVKYLAGATNVFRNVKQAITDDLSTHKSDRRYMIGVDLAKTTDFTVLTAIDMHTFDVVEVERFNQLDWNIQKARIETFWHRYNKGMIFLDSTGVGSPIFDDLDSRGISVTPYTFTMKSREDLLTKLALYFEKCIIKIPNDEILVEELESMQYEQHGEKLRMQVPDGQHDDTIMSLALAVWGLPEQKLPLNKQYQHKQLTTHNNSQY